MDAVFEPHLAPRAFGGFYSACSLSEAMHRACREVEVNLSHFPGAVEVQDDVLGAENGAFGVELGFLFL
jgi:hypothetical protein